MPSFNIPFQDYEDDLDASVLAQSSMKALRRLEIHIKCFVYLVSLKGIL